VTSASKQWQDSLQRRKIFAEAEKQSNPAAWREAQLTKQAGGVFINVLLSKKGYDKLGTPVGRIPQDAAFLRGAQDKETFSMLGDPPVTAPAGHDQWEAGFQQNLHALVIVADDSPVAACRHWQRCGTYASTGSRLGGGTGAVRDQTLRRHRCHPAVASRSRHQSTVALTCSSMGVARTANSAS
jgi:hypothetical protein